MKKEILLSIIAVFMFNTVKSQEWTQIGNDIQGEAAGDYFGYSVSLSSYGKVVAIGALLNDDNGSNSGNVRIFNNQGGTWSQIGFDIYGKEVSDMFGNAVSLNSDGSIVAIGAKFNDDNGDKAGEVRVYENQSGSWSQKGFNIEGESTNDQLGYSVSLNDDGNILATGAIYGSNNGYVNVHERSGSWQPVHGNIYSNDINKRRFGTSVSINADGTIVVVGDPRNDKNGNESGHVSVYQNQNDLWMQIGNDIYGESHYEHCGHAVSINSDGSVIAVGYPYKDANGNQSGCVRVYSFQGGSWIQIGNDIIGRSSRSWLGYSVDLNSDGTMLAVGAHGSSDTMCYAVIYENHNNNWVQIGSEINGKESYDGFGNSISLSDNGAVVAIGGYNNDDNGSDAGHVRIYGITPVITGQPTGQTNICDSAIFTVNAKYAETYQWQKSSDGGSTWSDISDNDYYSGSSSDTLIVQLNGVTDSYLYSCIVSNGAGSVTSVGVSYTIENVKPVISSTHPNQSIDADANCQAYLPDYTSDVAATDNCDMNLTITQNPVGGTIITGTTNTITLSVEDDAGNTSEVSFNTGVYDNSDPVINCVTDQIVSADNTNIYTVIGNEFDPMYEYDNCAIANVKNDFNNNTTLAGAQFGSGAHLVTWTITDQSGNTSTCSFNLTVDNFVDIAIMQENELSIYPNPVFEKIHFNFLNNEPKDISISDIAGKAFIQRYDIKEDVIIDISKLGGGIYIIKVESDQYFYSTKILKY